MPPTGTRPVTSEPLWLEWLALAGMLAFAAWTLGVRGVWQLLWHADPTGLTAAIVVVFVTASLWAGSRSRELQAQRALLAAALATRRPPLEAIDRDAWAGEYLRAVGGSPWHEVAALEVLTEHTHGPHGTAWWVNGIQLKLGLLGKVIGFSILALQIGQLQNFDPAQTQDLLRSLTSGLGVALLTTMVGLVGNILLGLQLTRLDRYADALLTECQRARLTLAPADAPATRPATP